MDLLDRLLGHDVWTTGELLLRCEGLSDAELDREFDIAHKSVRATLEHVIYNLEAWTDCMLGRKVRVGEGRSVMELTERLDIVAAEFAELARGVAERAGWDERWVDPVDGKERSFGGAIAHVITHSMHHRAQLLYLLRLLGVKDLPEGDALSWESQAGKS